MEIPFYLQVFVMCAMRLLDNRQDYRASSRNRSKPFSGSMQNNH